MSSRKYDDLQNLKQGKAEHQIKVRVIRFWRGVSSTGEEFKGFNVLLLDDKYQTIHAFVPALSAYQHERKLLVGQVCIIQKFTVQPYKMTDIFRSVRNDKQLIFDKNTKIQEIGDTGSNIQKDWFDLYAHGDLRAMSQQNLYLTDVVGIIKEHIPLNNFINKNGKNQSQTKLTITDGSSNVKVTFWDQFAEYFEIGMAENIEKPVIIIIASARVGLWNEQVQLSNVPATKFYLNYPHHSVFQLRKMLKTPGFNLEILTSGRRKNAELVTIEQLLSLGKEYIDIEVLLHVKIQYVTEPQKWYYNACSSCHNETDLENDQFICIKCNREVPYPELKFKIVVVASDNESGPIQIILADREVRALIGKRDVDMLAEYQDATQDTLPPTLKAITDKPYTIKIEVREANVDDHMKIFWATNICHGFKLDKDNQEASTDTMQLSTTEGTSSTIHLDQLSDLSFISPAAEKKHGKQVAE